MTEIELLDASIRHINRIIHYYKDGIKLRQLTLVLIKPMLTKVWWNFVNKVLLLTSVLLKTDVVSLP